MQPDQPYVGPPQPSQPTGAPEANYDFLGQQPQKVSRLPFANKGPIGRILLVLFVLILLTIVTIIIKGILVPPPFNSSDYTLVLERQQEMLHILTVDISDSTVNQLSAANQNFDATASLSLGTAQTKTIQYMTASKDKPNTAQISKYYSSTVDQQLTNALQTNNYNSVFTSIMQQELTSYEQELTSAYNSTKVSGGRSVLRTEYSGAKLLLTALTTTDS